MVSSSTKIIPLKPQKLGISSYIKTYVNKDSLNIIIWAILRLQLKKISKLSKILIFLVTWIYFQADIKSLGKVFITNLNVFKVVILQQKMLKENSLAFVKDGE